MKTELNLLYLELLKFPNSPKVYRELEAYYAKNNKPKEAMAFRNLLLTRFNEIPSLHDHNADSH